MISMDLFNKSDIENSRMKSLVPLAERMRPETLDQCVGQEHLIGEGKPLRTFIEKDEIPSLIFWGPPGCGKTTLARIIAHQTHSEFFQLNAVSSGVQDVRKILDRAKANRTRFQRKTILFIDEIHRFNKAQQDALLHSVEEGDIILIGATTENPSFEVISPLLSRCMVYVLKPLSNSDLHKIIDNALQTDRILKLKKITIGVKERDLLILLAGGDARIVLNGLETALSLSKEKKKDEFVITCQDIESAFQRRNIRYDKGGEEHYNCISAFIKSMRGSDPDAAVYWLSRLIEGGEDPKFIARRMIILASEDIGNADPFALVLATNCFTAVDYVGMPESRIILSQVAIYLASAPKSNASYLAIEEGLKDVREKEHYEVPLHLRNAPTNLMKELDYGKNYSYSHDLPDHFVDQEYLPEELKSAIYYRPSNQGKEEEIRKRLNKLWSKKQR